MLRLFVVQKSGFSNNKLSWGLEAFRPSQGKYLAS